MSKVLRVRLQDDMYELLEKLARTNNKSLSRFAAELLTQAVKQDMRETSTLNKLLNKLESLQATQSIDDSKITDEMNRKLLAIFELLILFATQFFIDKVKLQNFITQADELKQKFFE